MIFSFQWINLTCWVAAIGVMISLAVVFNYTPDGAENTTEKVFGSLYQSVFRVIWSLCLGFMVYACATSNGGKKNSNKTLKNFQIKSFLIV